MKVLLIVNMKHLTVQRGTKRVTGQRRWLVSNTIFLSLQSSPFTLHLPFTLQNKEKDQSKSHRHKWQKHKVKEVGHFLMPCLLSSVGLFRIVCYSSYWKFLTLVSDLEMLTMCAASFHLNLQITHKLDSTCLILITGSFAAWILA